MHKISALLLSILLIVLTGCEDKKPESSPIPIENTTEIFTQKDIKQQEDKKFKLQQKQEEILDTPYDIEASSDTFTLINTKEITYKVTVSNEKVTFHENTKPIVLINIFATWCPPCIGGLAYLNDLQKQHQKDLFVTGVLTHDTIDKTLLKTFIAKNQINYFISSSPHSDAFATLLASTLQLSENFSIPLTVMYVDGQYFTHYEGVVPVEMIEYDIQQAKKQLK